MKHHLILLIIVLTLPFSMQGQNRVNSDGERTGVWKGYYADSTLRYEATFRNGKPVGLMKRYDDKGRLSATMDFYTEQNRCFVKMYSNNGIIRAKGVYNDQKKDSVWLYLGADGKVRLEEVYSMGRLNGVSRSYYQSGNLSRKIRYSDGVKDGSWIQLFESGDTMLITHYKDGMMHGSYEAFYPDGTLQISGSYHRDFKDGDWKYFSEERDTLTVLRYDRGKLLNPEVLKESYESFIERIEENVGNIPDPALDGYK